MGEKSKENVSYEVNKTQVCAGVAALKSYLDKVQKDSLVTDALPIQLQVTLKKVPKVTNKVIKIRLPHSLVQPTSDICMFVKDLDRKERDYSPTERHFQDLLSRNGVKGITKVLPLKALKLEYKPFEAKRNLSDMYDVYLADANIVRLLPSFLGKNFYSRKRYPVQVDLEAKNLKKEIDQALNTAQCVISGRGSSCQVTVGHSELSSSQTEENVTAAMDRLASSLPGGIANIRNFHLKTEDSPAVPVYVSMEISSNVDLKVPTKKRKFQEAPEDVSTVIGAKVRVTQDGHIRIIPDGEEENSGERRKKYLATKTTAKVKKAKKVARKMKMANKARVKSEVAITKKSVKSKDNALKNGAQTQQKLNGKKTVSVKSKIQKSIVKKGKTVIKQPANKEVKKPKSKTRAAKKT